MQQILNMNQRFSLLIVFLFLALVFSDCAKRGRPTGGPKDEDAPIQIKADPPHNTTNFKEDEIKIYFDEYIKLKDLYTQLIVSPPLKNQPLITPLGTPSKYISIKILDTLKENTTYTFNFGQSVVDNNEGNILNNFKYVLSTGSIIDSLKVTGIIEDAFQKDVDKNVTVMLYESNDAYSDSIIYKEKPIYVANTLDSIAWEITNIKAGKYMLLALNDKSKNYIYNPKEDKIGFIKKNITVPTDTSYTIKLFNEVLPFKITRPSEISKGFIQFGYQGNADSLKIEPLAVVDDFKSFSNFEKDKDTLNYYFKGNSKDSIQFKVSNIDFKDTLIVKLRSKTIDSLKINSSISGTLHFKDSLELLSNIPVISIDTTKVNFIDGDSTLVNYTTKISKDRTAIHFDFDKIYEKKYAIEVLPGAITNFYGHVNDTLKYVFGTKKEIDYGKLYLTLQDVKSYPIIVQLITEKETLVEEIYATEEQQYDFIHLVPGKYMLRIIYDDNKNRKWDTGSFLLKQQPEKVIYIYTVLDIKANWEITETFIMR